MTAGALVKAYTPWLWAVEGAQGDGSGCFQEWNEAGEAWVSWFCVDEIGGVFEELSEGAAFWEDWIDREIRVVLYPAERGGHFMGSGAVLVSRDAEHGEGTRGVYVEDFVTSLFDAPYELVKRYWEQTGTDECWAVLETREKA